MAGALALGLLASCDRDERIRSQIDIAPFGKVELYRYAGGARNIVIYFSDKRGWREDFDDEAWGVAWPDRIVAGVDLPHLTNTLTGGAQCLDYAAAVKTLTDAVAHQLGTLPDEEPFLMGLEDGAAAAYAAAAQSAPNKIQAVVTRDFCPTLQAPLPPCPGQGGLVGIENGAGFSLQASTAFKAPFVTITNPAQCRGSDVVAFTKGLADARIVVPQPDQVTDLMVSVVAQTNARTSAEPTVDIEDLRGIPVVELPTPGKGDDRLAIILSGDGGWADIDKDIGERLAKQGIAMVGFNSLKYFWGKKSPDEAAADLDRVARHYLGALNRKRVLLVGFSFGADVLPLLYERLPADLQDRTALLALLAPSLRASFEVSVGGWVGVENHEGPELVPVLNTLKVPMLCVEGSEGDEHPCPEVANPKLEIMTLKGDHHFNGVYEPIAARIAAKTK